MRRRMTGGLLLAGLLLLAGPVWAQEIGAQQRSAYENIIIGEAYVFESISLTGVAKKLTAGLITPTSADEKGEATSAIITVNTATTYICFDGITATAARCHAFPATSSFMVYGTKTLKQMSLFSAGSTVSVTYCRSRGK